MSIIIWGNLNLSAGKMVYSEDLDKIVLLHVGRKLTIDNVEGIIDRSDEIIGRNPAGIALDFKELESIDSSGISFLVQVSKTSRRMGFELLFYNVGDALGRLFSVCGLDVFFQIIEKEDFMEKYL